MLDRYCPSQYRYLLTRSAPVVVRPTAHLVDFHAKELASAPLLHEYTHDEHTCTALPSDSGPNPGTGSKASSQVGIPHMLKLKLAAAVAQASL